MWPCHASPTSTTERQTGRVQNRYSMAADDFARWALTPTIGQLGVGDDSTAAPSLGALFAMASPRGDLVLGSVVIAPTDANGARERAELGRAWFGAGGPSNVVL